jgi:mono/diheme cytochrome c family protein
MSNSGVQVGSRNKRVFYIGGIAILLLVAGVLGTAYYVRRPRLTPALRGYEVAVSLGCFACHGPGGTGGVPNPGSDEEQIPAWDGGNAMMYVQNEREISEWILDGYPERLKSKKTRTDDTGNDGDHPSGSETVPGRTSPMLEMPAYKNAISGKDLQNLIAYYKAVAAFEKPPSEAQKGYAIASRLGCFGCHGPGGRTGVKNPASFKGYIPPWLGGDYVELVKNETELRQWILEGKIDRFDSNPFARYFTRRQIIQMPAYREIINEEELDRLISYIQWLQEDHS